MLRWKRPGPAAVTQLFLTEMGEMHLPEDSNNTEPFNDYRLAISDVSDAFATQPVGRPWPSIRPTIITPNAGGLNEILRLPGLPAGLWQQRIFSRWVTPAYQTMSYRQD